MGVGEELDLDVTWPVEVALEVDDLAPERRLRLGGRTAHGVREVSGPLDAPDALPAAAAVGERECSVQRRHQKVLEESPSPAVGDDLRRRMQDAALAVANRAGYRNAGTVEMLLGGDGAFHFMEMNNRLQVEHPVTEMRFDVDLVHEQLRVAQGLPLSFGGRPPPGRGHAIEARICAEDPANGFMPCTGRVEALQLPGGPGVRIDGHLFVGQEITLFYDSLLMKLVVHAATREAAIARLVRALHETRIGGLTTNVPLLLDVLADPRFVAGDYDTTLLDDYAPRGAGDGDPETASLGLAPVVAAALALHRATPARSVPGPGAGTGGAESAWVREGRRRIGEWPR